MRGNQAVPKPRRAPAPVHWLDMPDRRNVGYQIDTEAVELFMVHAGLNRSKLAEEIGSSKGYISDILGTDRENPRRTPSEVMLKKIADALGVKPRMLILRAVVANSVSDERETGSAPAVSA